MKCNQLELFEDMVIEKLPGWTPTNTCAQCENILAVQFQRRNLFFCTAQKGGQFGKKIKKSAPNCKLFTQGVKLIEHIDGYYGGDASKGLRR